MDVRMEQKAERRERILAAAREMIGELGYESLTMRDLARRARVTVPTLYNLIGGKQAVLFAAVEEQTACFVAALESSERAGGVSRALLVVESCARELLRLPSYYRSLLGILVGSDAASEMGVLVQRALIDEFEQALLEMREHAELESWADPAMLARSLSGQLGSTSMLWAGGALDSHKLGAASLYGVGLMLLGAARGSSRQILAEHVERAQRALSKPGARTGKPLSPRSREVADA